MGVRRQALRPETTTAIPVRDSVIVAALGLPNVDFREDWLIIGAIMQCDEIRAPLRECAEAADPGQVTMLAHVPELRLLDTVLWMRCSAAGRRRGTAAAQPAATGS